MFLGESQRATHQECVVTGVSLDEVLQIVH